MFIKIHNSVIKGVCALGGGGANSLSQNLTVLPAPSGREPLARPQALRFRLELYRYAKGPILEGAVERSETGGVQGATPSGDDGRGNFPAAPAGQKQCGKPQFASVFHTGFFSRAVCGKLPGARFQIGEKQTRKPE